MSEKLDSWNAPFDLNHDGKMSPEEKRLRDYTIMNTFFKDDYDSGGDGGGSGCLIPFIVITGLSGTAIAGVACGLVQAI